MKKHFSLKRYSVSHIYIYKYIYIYIYIYICRYIDAIKLLRHKQVCLMELFREILLPS